jgi:phosphoglycolate phosphatase-like HAD superfamily hydrolase
VPRPRALIFDLDEALLDRRNAWQYAVEESIAAVCGERLTARDLVAEYRLRPWSHALSVLVADRHRQAAVERACATIYERSAMKRLLVHEGIGVALDAVRAQRVEMGAISREPHRIAIKQIESTGLDRFLAVLSPTPKREPWDVADRLRDCARFLQREPASTTFVGCEAATSRRQSAPASPSPRRPTPAATSTATGQRRARRSWWGSSPGSRGTDASAAHYAAAASRGSTIWWHPGQYVFCRADRKCSSQLGQITTRRFKAFSH